MVSIPRASEGVECLIGYGLWSGVASGLDPDLIQDEEGKEENESPGLSEAEEEVRGLR